MCMKRKGVNSSCRSKTGMGVYAQDCWCPHGRHLFRRRARRVQVGRYTAFGRGLATTHVSRQRTKSHAGGPATPKDVKNEGRSGNVYENKGSSDTMTDNISGFCAWLHAILHKNTRILQKPASFCHFSNPETCNDRP